MSVATIPETIEGRISAPVQWPSCFLSNDCAAFKSLYCPKMREVQFWLPSVAQTRLCLSSLIAVSLSYVMLFCYFFFVCCLSFVVVTWKTSCRASTSSHHGNYSAKAPPIESFPACSFCTSQGNLKSQCHLLNTLKCGPWSRLHVRWGDLPHVTSPIWGPHLHVNSPQVRRQDGWKLAKSLLLFRFFFVFFCFSPFYCRGR